MQRILIAAAVAAVLGLAGAGSAHAGNLIVNGDFTDPNVGSGWGLFSSITGWAVNQDYVEVDNSLVVMPTCYTATCQSGEADGNTFNALSQSVSGLTIGQKYTLSWAYGDRPGSGPQQLNVSFGGNPVATDYGSGSGQWTANSYSIIADATTEILSFAAVDTSGIGGNPSVGNEITAVSLVGVPEPASMAVVGAGLFGFGLLRRKRA